MYIQECYSSGNMTEVPVFNEFKVAIEKTVTESNTSNSPPTLFFYTIGTFTSSVQNAMDEKSDELNPYECARDSGVLAFWDDPEEDIFTFDDGQPL